MSTRLSGVQIPVELDTKQAERKLDDLDRHLSAVEKGRASPGPGGSGGPSTSSHGSGGSSYSLAPRGPSGPYSYSLASQHSYSLKPSAKKASGTTLEDLKKEAQVKFGLDDDFARFTRIERIRKFARIHLTEAARRDTWASRAGSYAKDTVGITEGGVAAYGGKALAKLTGITYAAVSATSKVLPPIAAVISSTAGISIKEIQTQLDHFRGAIQYVESYVKTAVGALGKTYDTAEAVAYVTGRVPNLGFTYQYQRKAELYEDQLNKRLGNFKSDNLAASVGDSLNGMLRNGFNK